MNLIKGLGLSELDSEFLQHTLSVTVNCGEFLQFTLSNFDGRLR